MKNGSSTSGRARSTGTSSRTTASTCAGRTPGASSCSSRTGRPRPARLGLLGRQLDRHNGDRVLIFTHDNATVYTIARQFLVPVITHQTKTKERREILLRFNAGTYPIVATSRVLNEGVNVPEANVAVILSGSATVREHVQRLGRILR